MQQYRLKHVRTRQYHSGQVSLIPFALVPIVLLIMNGMSQVGRTHGSRPYVGVGDVNTDTESEKGQG